MLLLTISQINAHLRELLDADPLLVDLWARGEVSNLKRHNSGHYYFTLKDDSAALDAVMWRSHVVRLSAPLNNGDAVLSHGRVSIYEPGGRVQLYVDIVQPAGIGLLHARFEELKLRLETEGLFDPSRKRPLPPLPHRVGVATAPEGAALRDILTVLRRRCPLVDVLVAPCLVQGERAPASIVEALRKLYEANVDLIILARGGGAIEDLWSFNEERVARAVFASPVPLITGVGHETDTTIVDYVADLRAPTPSAAAELSVPDTSTLSREVAALRQQLDAAVAISLDTLHSRLDSAGAALRQHQPAARIARARQQLDEALQQASEKFNHTLALRRWRLNGLTSQLAALDPQATLRRGYTIVRRASDGRVVSSMSQISPGEELLITLHDGELHVQIRPPDDSDGRGENPL